MRAAPDLLKALASQSDATTKIPDLNVFQRFLLTTERRAG